MASKWSEVTEHVNWRRKKYSFLWRLVFLFILTIGAFSCSGNVALGTILRVCKEGLDSGISIDSAPTSTSCKIAIWPWPVEMVIRYAAAIGQDLHVNGRQLQVTSFSFGGWFPFWGNNHTNGMASMFSRHEPNRACLRHFRQTLCWDPTTSTNSPRIRKRSPGWVA